MSPLLRAAIALLCSVAVLVVTARHAAYLAREAARGYFRTDPFGISYASRLDNGSSASAHTRLYDDPHDRDAQVAALREDDGYAFADDDGVHSVAYAENKALFPVCNPTPDNGFALRCNGRNGFILHLALRGDATEAQQATEMAWYGTRWATIFGRLHPANAHCALVVLSSDATAEDERDNDDAGNGILSLRCFPTRP
jgi:hypothetical protein